MEFCDNCQSKATLDVVLARVICEQCGTERELAGQVEIFRERFGLSQNPDIYNLALSSLDQVNQRADKLCPSCKIHLVVIILNGSTVFVCKCGHIEKSEPI